MTPPRNTTSVREAAGEDAVAFAAFLLEAWRQAGPDAPGFTGADEATIRQLGEPEEFAARVAGPDRRMFLAWDEGDVVGFAATRRVDARQVELSGIVVLASHAGRGVGTSLVGAAFDAARREGYREMIVKTETDNQGARRFYERLGFIETRVDHEVVDGTTFEVCVLSTAL